MKPLKQEYNLPVSAVLLFLFIVLIGSAIGLILARNQTSRAFTIRLSLACAIRRTPS